MIIEADKISRTYRRGDHSVCALHAVSIRVAPGELVAISGPSGCGKTTLLHILGLLDRDFQGDYRFGGQEVAGMGTKSLGKLRLEKIGFMFQDFNLLPFLSVLDNVMLPHWQLTGRRRQAQAKAEELVGQMNLQPRSSHKPEKLSSGEAQRVALARALINDPEILIADEPTAHLDADSAEMIMQHYAQACHQGHAVLVASHDPLVWQQADRSIHLSHGQMVQPDPTIEQGAPT